MITKWKVFNFKSIRKEAELELGPLTIFAGENSSGKSTFIQSILLVAQTLAYKVGSRSVVLNGALASLGQFDDLKSNGSESDHITIEYTCQPLPYQEGTTRRNIFYGPYADQIQDVTCKISFGVDPSTLQRDPFQLQPRLLNMHLSCMFKDEDEDGEDIDQRAHISATYSNKDAPENEEGDKIHKIDNPQRVNLAYTVDMDMNSMEEAKAEFHTAEPRGCIFRHFLPDRIIYTIDITAENANFITRMLQNDRRRIFGRPGRLGRNIHISEEVVKVLHNILEGTVDLDLIDVYGSEQNSFLDVESGELTFGIWFEQLSKLPRDDRREAFRAFRDCDDLFDRIHNVMKKSPTQEQEVSSFVQIRPPGQISQAAGYLDDFFASSLKYLGPLRDAPKPVYPIAPAADPYDVGLRGEYTASILELHKNKHIEYIPSVNFKDSLVNYKTVSKTLEDAVIDWLQYLDVATSVESIDRGKLGHELKVELSNSDTSHDLTHVGVGVSQVLPILVMCLLANEDSTLVFEQPELHLHPKVQTLLGDFFLSMALCGRQCIVETHSEYFIDRLRFRIAAASADEELNNKIKTYFVEKSSEGSSFKKVVINNYGAVLDWPDGFFDQSQELAEEILKAATRKRRENKGENNA